MNKKVLLIIGYIWIVGLSSGCSSVRVSQDYDTGYHFRGPNSYAWYIEIQELEDGLQNSNELLAKRFQVGIDQYLHQRGFVLSQTPQYLISYNYTVISKIESDPYSTGIDIGYGRYGRYGGVGVNSAPRVRQYDLGKLQIKFYENASRQLVWQGVGTREVFLHSNPEEITRKVREMVTEILSQFPPR